MKHWSAAMSNEIAHMKFCLKISKFPRFCFQNRLQKLLKTEKLTSFAKGSKYSSEMFKLNWNPFSPYSKMCYT